MSSYPEVYHTAPAPTPARDDTRRKWGARNPNRPDVAMMANAKSGPCCNCGAPTLVKLDGTPSLCLACTMGLPPVPTPPAVTREAAHCRDDGGGFRQPDAGDVHVAVSPSPASATGHVPASRNLDSRAVFLAAGAQAAGFTVTVESTRELLARLDAPTGKTA